MAEYRNILREAVLKDPDLGEAGWKEVFIEKARGNTLYRKAMKEYVLSDISQALGKVHDVAIDAAKKMAVGRDVVQVIPVNVPLVRFYLAKRGKVWRVSEGPGFKMGERFSKTDISVDYEYAYDVAFSQAYIEDVPFPVLERAIADGSQLIEEQVTKDVVALYEAISAGNLAGGAEISAASAGTLAWADLVSAWTAVKKAGWTADVAMIHPDQIADLWADDKFIHSFYFGDLVDVERGVLGSTYLGFKIVETDLCTAAKCHLIDTTKAATVLMRRDITTQPYQNPKELREGALLSIRYGLGSLRESAVARIVSC